MSAAAATMMDDRRRLHLPKDIAAAAGLAAGRVVVSVGAGAGELIVSTPAAALARLQRRVAGALTLAGVAGSLSEVLARRPGRGPTETDDPAGPGRDEVVLTGDGPVLADTAVLTALLDAAPGSAVLLDLLPRVQMTEAVADELLATVLDAGLPIEPDPASGCDLLTITTTLRALGVTETARDASRAPVRVLEYELTKAGVATLAERVTLAVAATRAVPALLARAVTLPDTVTVAAYHWQSLIVPATPAPPDLEQDD